ncbi:MAG: nucleotide exchange factor GrpE [Methanothrix sp.]|nr:nucleotide exchange factor GrpE [Methanothrix sp.]
MTSEYDNIREEDLEVIPPEAEDQTKQPAAKDSKIEELLRELEQKTKEAATANDKCLRTYADFENYRKRMQREIADFRKYANEQFALELLPVVDHMGLALKHAGESGDTIQGIQQGVELVYKQLRDALEKIGVKQFVAEGEPFDPARHDAMMQVVTDEVPENTVVQVMQEGYLYHEKVLRHAKVGVSKRPDAKENDKHKRVDVSLNE